MDSQIYVIPICYHVDCFIDIDSSHHVHYTCLVVFVDLSDVFLFRVIDFGRFGRCVGIGLFRRNIAKNKEKVRGGNNSVL